jgi:tagaturonate epimerase
MVSEGKLNIDPTVNPAVLNTGTWEPEAVRESVAGWRGKRLFPQTRRRPSPAAAGEAGGPRVFPESGGSRRGADYILAELPDGQTVFLSRGAGSGDEYLQGRLAGFKEEDGTEVAVYPADDANIFRYVSEINIQKGPRALGPSARLGIGVRHSTALWPGIWRAMHKGGFAANAIQNSVRELHLLETLRAGAPPQVNHLFSVGPMQEGHTGSSFEGLWTSGVLSDLKSPYFLRYGADADHLQVKRGGKGVERTKTFIRASRYYSFYTLDVSDILDYGALSVFSSKDSLDYFSEAVTSPALRRDLTRYYRRRFFIGGRYYEFDEALLGRLVGKYWKALDAVEELDIYIRELRQGVPFDLELSIDENPPEFSTFETVTRDEELLFIILESERRGLSISHVAPNFGVEKCTDYRGDDGYEGLERRIASQHRIASHFGRMLDCHSGDDLSRRTRRIFGRATGGNIHFKVSPYLQKIFAETAYDFHPEFFRFWWDDTTRYVRECAEQGSTFAADALKRHERRQNPAPDPKEFYFQEYNFATLGKRDEAGQFLYRDRFYSLSPEFYSELQDRIEYYLIDIAEDLFTMDKEK